MRKHRHYMHTKPHKARLSSTSLAVIIVCSALLTVGIVLLFFSMYAVYMVYEVPMSLDISDHSSFNIDTDEMSFGKAVPGNTNTRTMVLSHYYINPLLMSFRKSGNISQYVSVPQEFYLEPGLGKEVSISAIIPKGSPPGHYEGTLTVYFRRI